MKQEYDFSNRQQGRCYRKDAQLNLPVSLEQEVQQFVAAMAERKNTDISQIVNELLRSDMQRSAAKP